MTVAAVSQALNDFNDAGAFFAHLDEDVLLEFPYGPTLGLPERIEGKAAVQSHLSAVQAEGLSLRDPQIQQVTPTRFLVEYTGVYRSDRGTALDVPLVALIDHDGTRIRRIREWWDTHLLLTQHTSAG